MIRTRMIGLAALAVLPAALAGVVAVTQMWTVQRTALSRWKRGGFGMYSDPHPHRQRFVWIRSDTDTTWAVRVLPPSPELKQALEKSPKARRAMTALFPDLRRLQNAPASKGASARVGLTIRDVLEAALGEPPPAGKLRVAVYETGISPDYDRIDSRVIAEREL